MAGAFRLLLLFAPLSLAAAPPSSAPQDPNAVPADPAADQAAKMLDFTQLDARMTVPVVVNSTGPFRFVVDTGAESSVVSRELASRLRLAQGPMVRMTSMSETSQVSTVIVPKLEVAALGERHLLVTPAMDARNIGAAGLLGIDTLSNRRVTIDFEKNTIEVRGARKRAEPRDPNEIVVRAASRFGQLIVTDATYEGQKIRVVIDTGSQVSMGNSAFRSIVLRRQKLQPVTLTSVTGGVTVADYSRVPNVTFGSIQFSDLPVAFADVAPFERFGLAKKPALLLGMDALQSFRRVDIDFANREVRLLPPKNLVNGERWGNRQNFQY